MLAASPDTAGAHEYVVNGDFEDGTEGWALISSNSQFDTQADGVAAVRGSSRARVILDQQAFTLTQSFANVGPGHYTLSAWVRTDMASPGVVNLGVNPLGVCTDGCQTTATSDSAWQHLTLDVDLHNGAFFSVRIWGSGSTGDTIYVDDVRFEGAPPVTMTPTYTATATDTPVPPSPTKTLKPTNTPKATNTPKPTRTPNPGETPAPVESATPAQQASAPGSALDNRGFEDVVEGVPAPWEKYGGSLTSATAPVRSGTRSARFESTTDATKWVFQTVTVSGGDTNAFGVWILHEDASVGAAFLRVSWYATHDGSGTAIGTADSVARLDSPSPEWRYVTTEGVTAPPEARSAKLRIMLQPKSSARAAIYVDDASWEPASPAATQQDASGDDSSTVAEGRTVAGTSRRPSARASSSAALSTGGGTARIVINEVLYDAVGDGTDADGEWVELYNAGDLPASLEGWALADNTSVDVIDAITIPGRGFAIVAASPDFSVRYPSYQGPLFVVDGSIGNQLGNDGDVLLLVDPAGGFVDAISWGAEAAALDPAIGDVPAGHSIERRTPGLDTGSAGDFVDNESPSPGLAYSPGAGSASVTDEQPSKSTVQVLDGGSGLSTDWLPWALAAVSMAALAGVASWRLFPAIAGRLRHP